MNLRKYSEEDYEKAIQMYKEGYAITEIDKILGISQGALYHYFRKNKIKVRSRTQARALAFLRGRYRKCDIRVPKEEWKQSYFAGLVDGEGSVFLRNGWNQSRVLPMIRVNNTDSQMIKWINDNFGGGKRRIIFPKKKGDHGRLKPLYRWETSSILGCKMILEKILPFLITKRENAEKVLVFCRGKINKMHQITVSDATTK